MNKSRFFSKLNHKGKIILGFMAVGIVSPVILAACGSSNSVTPNKMLGEKEALEAASLLLGYKQNNKNAIFTSTEQMENFYYTGNVDTPKSSTESSSNSKKASIFSNHLYYYAVPGNPTDPNSQLFYEGEISVMNKLSEISGGKFTNISFLSYLSGSNLGNLGSLNSGLADLGLKNLNLETAAFNAVAGYWWHSNYAGVQKRVQEDFAAYKLTGGSDNLNVLPNLKILLAPTAEIAQFLVDSYINAYGQHSADKDKLPISTGWGF